MTAHDHPFDRDPQVVLYSDIEGPPLTDEMVIRATAELGRPLPSSYLELMSRCNGGYLRDSCVATSRPNSWARDHVSVGAIFGVPAVGDDGQFGTGAGVLCTKYMTAEWGLPEQLVLFDGDGHTWTAFDYRDARETGEPSIVWIDVELGDELTIAPSFGELLLRLRPVSDFPNDDA